MTISRWKGLKLIINKSQKTKSRAQVISPSLIGKTILVHTGREEVPLIIKNENLGSKLGELVPTKKIAIYPRKNTKR